MGIYAYIWVYMGIYGYKWVYMGISGYIWVYMGIYGLIRVFMGIYLQIFVYKGIYGYILVYMGAKGYICVGCKLSERLWDMYIVSIFFEEHFESPFLDTRNIGHFYKLCNCLPLFRFSLIQIKVCWVAEAQTQ